MITLTGASCCPNCGNSNVVGAGEIPLFLRISINPEGNRVIPYFEDDPEDSGEISYHCGECEHYWQGGIKFG